MFDRGFSEAPWRRNGGNLGRPLKLRTSRPEDEALIGNAHLGARRLAQAQPQQCPQGQFWDGRQCRGSIGTNPQGGGFPGQGAQQPPAGGGGADAAATQTPSCGVPSGYGPNESGAALACRAEDGTFTVYDYPTGSLLQTGVTQVCLDQWGNVTMADDGNPRCGNAPTGGTDCDKIPTDRPVVVCPPSNGVVVNYVVDAATGALITTGISSSCALPPNARQADVSDPYCSGGLVYGEGNAQPELVACELQGGSYEIRNASDFSLVAQGVTWAQLQTEYKNRRVLVTRNCSAIPGSAGGAPAAGGAPPTGPAPVPAPNPPPAAPPTTTTPIQTGPGTEAGAGGQPTGGTGVLPGQTIPISPGSMTSPRFLQPVPVQAGGGAAAPGGVSAPGMTPLPYDMLRAIGGWSSEPQALVRALYRKYGRPDIVSAEHIVWKNRGQWYLTVVQNDQVIHNWPEPHYDFLYQVIRYPIDPKYYGDIAKFDGSVILDRTLGFLGSMCGDEGLNFLAVNLAHDIAAGDISVGEAQDAFVEAYRQYKEGGAPAYTQAIQFPVSPDYVGNPGAPA